MAVSKTAGRGSIPWSPALAAHGCRRVAFPAISAGVYGYPLAQAARVAIDATRAALAEHPEVREARFWLFDTRAHDAFADALQQ